ncbi:OLC1v1023515C1 [Oldenlandia corymbosa var. corymbosa]|uniref:OLC1v1023515C1 n=1 Tax=Oldenlandia corymbosa var. corymbosa TaxID=529605 RepID=A0AAV1C043_OLDCO|nr:OLC1v1023515C1 [Oldenlandia corymbosa var. corymbosa]
MDHDGSKAATQMTCSIVLEVLPSNSEADKNGSVLLDGDEEEEKKKKRKRKRRDKKKRLDPKEELLCLFPFTTSSSAIQRKIKNQYPESQVNRLEINSRSGVYSLH